MATKRERKPLKVRERVARYVLCGAHEGTVERGSVAELPSARGHWSLQGQLAGARAGRDLS